MPSSRPDELAFAIVFLMGVAGFARGAVVVVVFGAERLTVVNPVRVYRIPVEDIGSLFETFVPLKGRPPVLGLTALGRRRPIRIWAVFLYESLFPPLGRRQLAQVRAVQSWAAEQGLGHLRPMGRFKPLHLSDEARRRAFVHRVSFSQRRSRKR